MRGTPRALFCLLCLPLLAACPQAPSTPPPGAWPSPRQPFTPVLEDGTAAVCTTLFASARQAFLSKEATPDLNAFLPDDTDVVSFTTRATPFALAEGDALAEAARDLDGDGRIEVLVQRANTWSWRGPSYSAHLFADAKTLAHALATSADVDALLAQGQQVLPAPGDGSPMTASASWAWNAPFAVDGAYYVLDQGNAFARERATHVQAWRLNADGSLTQVCTLRLLPDAETPLRAAQPAFGAFLDSLWAIARSGPEAGTLQAGAAQNQRALGTAQRAALRPWTLRSVPREGPPVTLGHAVDAGCEHDFLCDWSLGDPWSRREYLTFREHLAAAPSAYAAYLTDAFGLSPQRATGLAPRLLEAVLTGHVMVPGSFPEYGRDQAVTVRALLTGATDFSADPAAAAAHIAFAIDNPRALAALLAAGAEVDSANDYGKTLLMQAAHLNRIDTLALLLAAGADVHVVTHAGSGYPPLAQSGRSALLYAAENADVVVMTMLIEAGADVAVRDATGAGIDDYLRRNPRYRHDDGRQPPDFASLLARQRTATMPGAPALPCASLPGPVSTPTCEAQAGALLEADLERARAAWLARADETATTIATDEQAWRQRRDTECGAFVDDYARAQCTLQRVRARARYYEQRIAASTR